MISIDFLPPACSSEIKQTPCAILTSLDFKNQLSFTWQVPCPHICLHSLHHKLQPICLWPLHWKLWQRFDSNPAAHGSQLKNGANKNALTWSKAKTFAWLSLVFSIDLRVSKETSGQWKKIILRASSYLTWPQPPPTLGQKCQRKCPNAEPLLPFHNFSVS